MTTPEQPTVPNTDNSPGGLGNTDILNSTGVGNVDQPSYLTNLANLANNNINLDPFNQPPTMKTLVYSPDIMVKIATATGQEYDVSSNVVNGTLYRVENSASTFFCELTNANGQYTKNGGIFSRMDRITVYMKRTTWVQVFSGYLDTVPFAQIWAGNVSIKATCTLKRLLYTYWNPNLAASALVFNQFNAIANNPGTNDRGIGDLLGNLICWIGGWEPQNVHIQDFPLAFYNAMLNSGEFQRLAVQNDVAELGFKTLLLGSDTSAGVGGAAGQKYLTTGPGLGPQVADPLSYRQQVLQAVDDRGMGPKTADIQNAYATEQLAATGQNTRDNAVRTSMQQQSSLGGVLQTQAREADAAILAFACVYAESGWRMYANTLVPRSLQRHYDAIGNDHDSIGLFQQRNQGWGTVEQRMNAYASAGMFLDALAAVDGWENMDPAQAISRVQRNRDGALTYGPWIEVAKQEVQALRAGAGKYTPQNFGGVGLTSVTKSSTAQNLLGAGLSGGVPGISQNSPSPSALPIALPGRPQPDAQGAVLCAQSVLGRPYVWGGKGPAGFDCSGLIYFAYKSIGIDVGEGTGQQALTYKIKVPSLAQARPGDAVQINGGAHTVMWMGDGTIIEAADRGIPVRRVPINFRPDQVSGIYRWADWGGPGPAPFNPLAGPGTAAGTGSVGGVGGTGSEGQSEPIARNLFSYMFTPARFAPTIAEAFSGEKSFIDSQPLIQEVQAVTKAGLRNFASAPNGDFIAYYPDYFGVDGKPIAMTIENIEMKDVRINLSDDAMTTHVYVAGDPTQGAQPNSVLGWLSTAGIATVENETLYQRLKQVVPGGAENLTGKMVLQKYGVRPLQLEFNMAGQAQLEFLLACQVFMQKWAEQYETAVSFTFMPELFPGMRIQLADTGIAVYVSEVTHTFDWERGFFTSARIMAPSAINGGQAVNTLIPIGTADSSTPDIPTNVPTGG